MTTVGADPRQGAVEAVVQEFADSDDGRSVVVSMVRGGTLEVDVHGDALRPAASLVKVPIVASVYELADQGALDLDADVARGDLGTTAFGTVFAAFGPEHRFTLRELCALTLVASDNLAAEHLLSIVGPEAVNRTATRLAGPSTRLVVGFSDPYLGTDGLVNTTTAREALRLITTLVSDAAHAEIARALRNNIRNPRLPLRLS